MCLVYQLFKCKPPFWLMEEATMQDATCALGATAILTPPQRAESIWSFTIMDA